MGIEYDFGRVKWYYTDHHTFSMDRLQNGSMAAFVATVVTLGHTRKFARKARDYMRAYRVSATGLDADSAARVMKSHRCMLDLPPASRSPCGTQKALPEEPTCPAAWGRSWARHTLYPCVRRAHPTVAVDAWW